MYMFKFSIEDKDEDKPALELTPELIDAVKTDSATMVPQVEEAKRSYLSQAMGKNLEEHGEILDQLWSDYIKTLGRSPKTLHESFPDFETWYQENKFFLIQWFNQHFTTPKNPEPFNKLFLSQDEITDQEQFLKESIAPSIYQKCLALDRFNQIGLNPASQTNNPISDFNNLMSSYSRGLADHYANQLKQMQPEEDRVATFVIGYPGSGKSSILELEDTDKDNPIRSTKYGILIDPDEFQPLLPGYSAGARSQDVLIYAKQLIAKKLQNEALGHGLSFVNPQVGGQSNILAKDIAEALLHGYNVNVILKQTSKEESQARTLKRAMEGGRLIMPLLGKTDPIQSYNELVENPDLIIQKIKSEMKQRIKSGNTESLISNKELSEQEISNLLSKVQFTISPEESIKQSSVLFKLIRTAKKLEENKHYNLADKIIGIALDVLKVKK